MTAPIWLGPTQPESFVSLATIRSQVSGTMAMKKIVEFVSPDESLKTGSTYSEEMHLP
jgi:hypothetical protein